MTTWEKAGVAVNAAEALKAQRIVILDLQEQTQIADYFIICTGTSDVHIRAIADEVIDKMVEAGFGKPRREGLNVADWVLLDYGDVVVHIFTEENREHFGLESFWSGAKVIELTEESRREEASPV